jgi:membrane-bound lytic murein transglycosylase D
MAMTVTLLVGCSPAAPKTVQVPAPPEAAAPSEVPPQTLALTIPLAARAELVRAEIASELPPRPQPVENARIRESKESIAAANDQTRQTPVNAGPDDDDPLAQPAAIDDLPDIPPILVPVDPNKKEAVEAVVRNTKHDLPIEINARVLAAVEYFQNGRGRKTMAVGLERAGLYRPMMERILKEEGVPIDLVYLSQVESAFLPRALSRAKARGLWQFISSRGKEYGLRQTHWIDERSDPEKSTRAAARHLSDLYSQFNDWYLAMAAYNAGPARVEKALKKTGATTFWQLADKKALPKETLNYVPTILAMAIIGNGPELYGFDVEPSPPLKTERVALEDATDFRVISEKLGISVDDLRELNPHVLRWTTPPDDSEFEFILPVGYSEKFFEKVASLAENERILFRYHNVKKGDTLSAIARKYGVAVSDLTQVNKITTKTTLRVGQELMVPISGVLRIPSTAMASASKTTPASEQTPAPKVYQVKRGDTLSSIAARFNLTVDDLKKWNKLTSTRLDVGQKLTLVPPVVRQAN